MRNENLIQQMEPHEIQSPLWMRLERHLKARVSQLRHANDRPQSETETATIRGQIKELQMLLNLGKPRKVETIDSED